MTSITLPHGLRGTAYAAAAVVLCLAAAPARADMIFAGAGTNPEAGDAASGRAVFAVAGDTLTLVLTNTTGPRTVSQGNALTGVTFDVAGGSPALALSGVGLTAGGRIWASEAAGKAGGSLAGSWTDDLGDSPLGAYGVATTGYGGRFDGGSISLGTAGPDYGIVAAGTFGGADVVFGGGKFPFVQDSLTFTFAGAAGVSESQIRNVKFLFGTDGTGVVPAGSDSPAPAPAGAVLFGLGVAALGGAGLARRRR
jgi:hypothetical protein